MQEKILIKMFVIDGFEFECLSLLISKITKLEFYFLFFYVEDLFIDK